MSDTGASYFIKVYGSQCQGNRPKYSHTFATFTKVLILADRTEPQCQFTISWLPQDGEIKPLGGPEPGRNYTLSETLAWLDENGSDDRWESPVTAIDQRLFETALLRLHELRQGTLKYVMIDNLLTRPHIASNCIHAVSDLPLALNELGMCYTGVLHGNSASRFVYQYLSPFFATPPQPTPETEQRFEQVERDHFRAAMAMESMQPGLEEQARSNAPSSIAARPATSEATPRAAPETGVRRQLVYVHGICRHLAGFSDPWWSAMRPYTPSLLPGDLGGNRREVLWSDLVVPLRAAAITAAGQEEQSRRRIQATLQDRLERQLHNAIPQARGGQAPHPVTAALALPAIPGWECIDDFMTYLFNDGVREQILGGFHAVVRPLLQAGAQIEIISHSWGTVIAYEALRQMDGDSQLPAGLFLNLFTVGSALSILEVQDMLLPTSKDGRRPRVVRRWVNLNAHGDIVGGRLQDNPFQVDAEFLNLDPISCGSFLGVVNPSCAHGSYFVPANTAVNRDIFGAYIEG